MSSLPRSVVIILHALTTHDSRPTVGRAFQSRPGMRTRTGRRSQLATRNSQPLTDFCQTIIRCHRIPNDWSTPRHVFHPHTTRFERRRLAAWIPAVTEFRMKGPLPGSPRTRTRWNIRIQSELQTHGAVFSGSSKVVSSLSFPRSLCPTPPDLVRINYEQISRIRRSTPTTTTIVTCPIPFTPS